MKDGVRGALRGTAEITLAQGSNTLLVRWSPSTGKQLHWTIDARPETWSGSTPLLLQPYDVLYVPNTPVDEVAIWVDNYIRRMIPFPYIIPPVAR